ncbi:MAG TPA: hypothetical protein VGH11_01670 [Jatrophihabitans sp.]|jgi:hypothetical protein
MITAGRAYPGPHPALDAAARRMFEAELALHDAHQSRVDSWIAAASDRLHDAIERHTQALMAAGIAVPAV